MVGADHSSCCVLNNDIFYGGEPAGFVLKVGSLSIYHCGDTNVFYDMENINYLYKPTHLLIPIGGFYTMGPKEAGFAVARFLKSANTVIPMHFGTFPALKGTVEEFTKEFEKFRPKFKRD